MPNWNQLLDEVRMMGNAHDVLRRKYLAQLYALTGRNIIIYYSGWMQKPGVPFAGIADDDKNGFMTTVSKLDRSKGLDLVLHTPGGETAATESIVDYLRNMFGTDIRAIVPQLALSSGTMIACACKSIVMGKQSSLGPVDPQYNGMSAHGIIEEFSRAITEIKQDPALIPVWQPVIAKYSPALVGECQKAVVWSEQLVREWLKTGMLKDDPECEQKIDHIVADLTNHALTLSHARHLSARTCMTMGLVIEMMDDDDNLHDAILSLHHACMMTIAHTAAFKIIENHMGIAFIQQVQTPLVQGQQ